MTIFAIQYLEDGPKIPDITPQKARSRLRAAFDRLPIDILVLGWHLPDTLVDACASECESAGVTLYRWHPLLTGDSTFMPKPMWQTIGLDGAPVPGFRAMPEFTFVCPNRPAVQEAVHSHVRALLRDDRYQGIFLDRMRYPAPAANPEGLLGCFCGDCRRAAAREGLDLTEAHAHIIRLLAMPGGPVRLLHALLAPDAAAPPHPNAEANACLAALRAFLDFRTRSVSRFVRKIATLAHSMGKTVGLDCFSPALAGLVGQDLKTLSSYGDWVKIMSYGHAMGPAGMPFELLAMVDWLIEAQGMGEQDALAALADATQLPLPPRRAALREHGLAPRALRAEAQRARSLGINTLLAGIELVEMKGVAELNSAQIAADLAAFHAAEVDGLAISWDLWEIPLERLEIVRARWH